LSQYELLSPLGYVQLSNPTSATGLSPPPGARTALIVVSSGNIRFRDDGAAPTSSLGLLLVAGGQPFGYAGRLSALQFIAASGTPVVDITFYQSG